MINFSKLVYLTYQKFVLLKLVYIRWLFGLNYYLNVKYFQKQINEINFVKIVARKIFNFSLYTYHFLWLLLGNADMYFLSVQLKFGVAHRSF